MTDWSLVYDRFDPERQGLREALCATGNGYFVSRGAFCWVMADKAHYPATYLSGGYNRAQTEVAGRVIENEDLVNLPNWSALTFRIADGDWFNIQAVEILSFQQALDLFRGVLEVTVRFRDKAGRESTLITRRLVSMANMHLAGIELSLTAHNWSGPVQVRSALDGRVINAGVKRYRDLNSSHLTPLAAGTYQARQARDGGEALLHLMVETKQSRLRVAQAARTRVVSNPHAFEARAESVHEEGYVQQDIHCAVGHGETVVVEKLAALFTSRDTAISEPGVAAREAAAHAPAFSRLRAEHERVWRQLWDRCDIALDGDAEAQMILRLHIFHLLQTLSPNTINLDVGVPARGWHGEAYRGHVFWDELFILPFLNYRLPAISRSCLRYRHLRLPMAREAAAEEGLKGAMFPWQSGSDGREESQKVHLNPRSGRWVPDNSCIQRHVSLAIAYNAWRHFQITGSEHFLELRGAELILEVTRFFASLAHLNGQTGRYEIHHVMGPDEYHEAYPDSEEPGLNNNAYTNVLVAWLCNVAMRVLACLDAPHRAELMDKLLLDERELALWDDMSRKMTVCFHNDGIISQFEGYENLKEFDWEGYRKKYGDIQRLDRILEAEGDSPDRYKLSKQADVLMLFYLFSREELSDLMQRLGYEALTHDQWQHNIDYYLERTSHGSTLSYMVHAAVMARSHPDQAWDLFQQALRSDIADIQGGTTPEGIHLGAMAGTVDLVQRCFTGLDVRDGALHFDPVFGDRMGTLKLKLRYLGRWLHVVLKKEEMTVAALSGWVRPVTICVRGEVRDLSAGEAITFRLSDGAAQEVGRSAAE